MNESVKIIHKVAREMLKPEGFVQLGSSRHYAKDYGYFSIWVTYKPFSYREGSLLEVFISFYFDNGYEDEVVRLFIDYDGDEIENKVYKCEAIYDSSQPDEFEKGIREMTVIALDAIKTYSRFVDLEYACKRYSQYMKPTKFWYFYTFGLLLLLAGKYNEGIEYLHKTLGELENKSLPFAICPILKRKLEVALKEKFTNKIQAQEEMVNMVNDIRSRLAKENKYKRMKLEIPFSLPDQNTQ